MTVNFRGYIFNDAGNAIQGASVKLLETGTTTQEGSTVTTGSDGLWYFNEADQDRYDVEITKGSSVRRIRWDDQISLKEIDVRNNTAAGTPAATLTNLTNSASNQVAVFSGANTTRADNDEVYLSFKLANSAAELIEYGRRTAVATDVTDGTEDGQIEFDVMKAGTLTKVWTITSSASAAMSWDVNVDALTIGSGADTDISLTFDANSADGVITWMEDEDYFQFSDDILMSTTERINLRDTAIYIYSSADGQLDLVADTEIQIAATTIDIDGAVALNGAITGATNITLSGELDAATLDISGVVQIDGALTVGVDDTGLDVKFFGASAGAYMEWDESADQLRIMGASADATTSTGKLLLATSLTDINANDVIGKIEFQAPHEAGGTDAITVAASIQAIAQGTFSSSVNATDLIFYTGHSEAATEKFRITSQGELGVGGANYGTDGQVLTSTGAGTAPAWEDVSGAVSAVANGADNRVATFSSSTALNGEASLTFDGSDLTLANDVGLIFGDAGEKIEGDGTDLFISGNKVNIAVAGAAGGVQIGGTVPGYGSPLLTVFKPGYADTAIACARPGNGPQIRFANGTDVHLSGQERGTISCDGSSTSYNTSSDYRLKENETAISDGLTRVKALKPYRFNFKADSGVTRDGFFAHEAAAVVPTSVTGAKDATDSNGDPAYQGMDNSKLVPILVAAIKEIDARVTALE